MTWLAEGQLVRWGPWHNHRPPYQLTIQVWRELERRWRCSLGLQQVKLQVFDILPRNDLGQNGEMDPLLNKLRLSRELQLSKMTWSGNLSISRAPGQASEATGLKDSVSSERFQFISITVPLTFCLKASDICEIAQGWCCTPLCYYREWGEDIYCKH